MVLVFQSIPDLTAELGTSGPATLARGALSTHHDDAAFQVGISASPVICARSALQPDDLWAE